MFPVDTRAPIREARSSSPSIASTYRGDDIRRLDWKVYGKSDRYYIKEYEEETNLKAYIVVDTSKSMAYGSDGITKLEYAKYMAAALTYLITQQQDAAALVLWGDELRTFLPPGNNPLHLRNVYTALSAAEPDGGTQLSKLLLDLGDRVRQKSLMVVISDFLDNDTDGVMRGLRFLGHKGHDVIVFNVLDHAELEFPFERMTQFEGLEIDEKLLADPKSLRKAYLEEVEAFTQQLRAACLAARMDYVLVSTESPLDVTLSSYLAARAGTR